MIKSKLGINMLFWCALLCALPVFNVSAAEYEPFDDKENEANTPLETKNMGIYLLSKVVDASTDAPLSNVEISSDSSKTITDANGEFLIPVKQDGYIFIKLDKYKETSIKVSSIKGKIKLEVIPKMLPLFPNIGGSLSYKNTGMSESYDGILSSGRFNDGFGIDASGKLYSVLLGLGYENFGGILNRNQSKETANISNNNMYLKAGYIFNLLKDTLDIAPSLKGTYSGTTITNKTMNEDYTRDKDYLDFNNQKIGLGLDIEIVYRPIKYNPLVLGGTASYYPIMSISQETGGDLPSDANGFDFGVYARYDIFNTYVIAKYSSKSLFSNRYNSNLSGFNIGIGYAL